MIEKMKFVSITGPKEDFDRMVGTYLARYEMHLENALSELKTVQNLSPFLEKNPYKDKLARLNQLVESVPETDSNKVGKMDAERADMVVEQVYASVSGREKERGNLIEELDRIRQLMLRIEPFKEMDIDLQELQKAQFVKPRFGKIVKEHYRRLEHYMLDDTNSIFYKCSENAEYVWGIYFVPVSLAKKVDAMYASMHFEREEFPEEYEGTPMQSYLAMDKKRKEFEQRKAVLDEEIRKVLEDSGEELIAARDYYQNLSDGFEIRKLAACFQEEDVVFYIVCGWMSERDANALEKELENDSNTFCMEEDPEESAFQEPPTKLKNPGLFKPFEMFTRMYGLPNYHEMDPTIFIALTYTFIFGAMFGDVGQGLVLAIGGALLYKFKKNNLAGIIGCAGVFSTIFGFLFGSVFGFEDLIEAIWLKPREHMTKVPLIGELNTVFVVAIGFGMGLILLVMVFHIINAVKEKNLESLLFDTNGVAGLVFYGSLVAIIALLMLDKPMPATAVLIVMFVIPLILIALKEPLGRLVERKADIMPKEKGMFVVQTFFELFEVLLSYFSNTLSFIRVGAFAISHAAMMEVVMTLAGMESGSGNWVVVVIGNIIVCGLEGLIVGIQVLRLEYYEMFSRFYKGTGREFVSYKSRTK